MKTPAILLVDDEQGQRDNVKSYIELRVKCTISEASSAKEAIDFIKSNPCDLMVLDIRMPGAAGSGVDVLDVAKELPIITIVFTGWDSEHVYKQCIDRGAKAYIAKNDSIKIIGEKIIKELKEAGLYSKA